jgi:hypothetical protein
VRPRPSCTPTTRRVHSPVALALLAGGCATAALPPPAVRETARAAPTYSGRLRVSLKGPGLRARTRALLAFRRPDALRIEIPGPTGARLVAVARGGALAAVFPGDRAVFLGEATPAELDALLGVGLAPEEIIDLLVGVGSPRLRAYRARWGPALPAQIEATLPDGSRLEARVEDAEAGLDLPPAAFVEPPHAGYRRVTADEARRLWGAR